MLTDAAAAHRQPHHRQGPRGRHGLLRPAAGRGRPGHHHLQRDDHRRGDGRAAGQGARHAWPTPVPSCSSTSSPAARTPPSPPSPRSGSPPPSPAAGCCEAAAAELGEAVANLTTRAGVITHRAGKRTGYGALAAKAAERRSTKQVAVDPQGALGVQGHRHAAQPDRRRWQRHRAQEVRHGPRRARTRCRPWSAGRRPSTARSGPCATRPTSRPCRASPTSRSSPPASRCAAGPSASASTRSAPCDVDWGAGHRGRQVRRRTCCGS